MPAQYRIKGSDGRDYGPVALEVVARWIGEGRIVPATPVSRDDGPPAEARGFPEIDAIFRARTEPPAAPALLSAAGAPPAFRVWDLMGRAWALVKPHWLPLAAMFFILWALGAVPYAGFVVHFIVGGPIMVGIWRALLGMIDGRAPDVGMMFGGFDRFGDAFLASLIAWILIALGFIAFIVPGVILSLLWVFIYPVLGETRLGFWEAMRRSAVLTEGNRWRLFLLALACLPVLLLGALAFCVGLFLAVPVCYTAFALAYQILKERKGPAGGAS